MPFNAAAFAAALRDARLRRGLTQREVAAHCGTNHTHISRLESASGRVPSRRLLERIATALGGAEQTAELFAAAARIPDAAEAALSPQVAALVEPALSKQSIPALRRIALARTAEALLQRLPARGITRGRVDAEALCRVQGLRVLIKLDEGGQAVEFEAAIVHIRDPGKPGESGVLPRVRFLQAHAAAHRVLGEDSCAFPRADPAEGPALELAALLLAPADALRRALSSLPPEPQSGEAPDYWSAERADVAALVAQRLAVPGWLAVRRLADEDFLLNDALDALGEQP